MHGDGSKESGLGTKAYNPSPKEFMPKVSHETKGPTPGDINEPGDTQTSSALMKKVNSLVYT